MQLIEGIFDGGSNHVARMMPGHNVPPDRQFTFAIEAPLTRLFETAEGARLDSGSAIIEVENQLQHVFMQVAEMPLPPIFEAFPTTGDVPAGSESFLIREVKGGGRMRPMSAAGTDSSVVQDTGRPHTGLVTPYELGYEYTYQEILKAVRSGNGLEARRAMYVRRGYMEQREECLILGDARVGTRGLLTTPRQLFKVRLTNNGAADATALVPDGTGSATAAEVRLGLFAFINRLFDESGESLSTAGGHILLVPPKLDRWLSDTVIDSTQRNSLKEELRIHKGVQVVPSVRMANVDGALVGLTAGSLYQFIALVRADSLMIAQPLPHPHQFFAAQMVGMKTCVPSYAEIGEPAVFDVRALGVGWYQSS